MYSDQKLRFKNNCYAKLEITPYTSYIKSADCLKTDELINLVFLTRESFTVLHSLISNYSLLEELHPRLSQGTITGNGPPLEKGTSTVSYEYVVFRKLAKIPIGYVFLLLILNKILVIYFLRIKHFYMAL